VRNDGRFDFMFFAVPDPSINAFAMPGGYIASTPAHPAPQRVGSLACSRTRSRT
jgi:hypothetical protein